MQQKQYIHIAKPRMYPKEGSILSNEEWESWSMEMLTFLDAIEHFFPGARPEIRALREKMFEERRIIDNRGGNGR